MSRPVEPVAAVLWAPEMRSYAFAADAAWTEGRLSVNDLRLFWKWRCWRRKRGIVGIATLAEIRDFCVDKGSPAVARARRQPQLAAPAVAAAATAGFGARGGAAGGLTGSAQPHAQRVPAGTRPLPR